MRLVEGFLASSKMPKTKDAGPSLRSGLDRELQVQFRMYVL